MLTIGFISLPQRVNYVYRNDVFSYIKWESFYFTIMQQMSFFVLALCLIRIPSMSLAFLFKEVSSMTSASVSEKVKLLESLKKNYYIFCNLVANINGFVGYPLFIFILHVLFEFISLSVLIFHRRLSNNAVFFLVDGINILLLFKFIMCIISLAVVSDKIPLQVSYGS